MEDKPVAWARNRTPLEDTTPDAAWVLEEDLADETAALRAGVKGAVILTGLAAAAVIGRALLQRKAAR